MLFGGLADSGRIKERKNGSYRMVLKGIDDIEWFTDRPDRVAGEWSPKKLVKKWKGLYGDVEPNAQATFEVGNKRKHVAFEMFKPTLSESNQTISFKVRGIGASNIDDLTGLAGKKMSSVSLFIDNADSNKACDNTAISLNNFFNGPWGDVFGPEASPPYANVKDTNYAFVSLYENEETQPFTPSQQYEMVQSSLQYVADTVTEDGNNFALQPQYSSYNSDDLGNVLISGEASFGEVFASSLLTATGEGNPWSDSTYGEYQQIANEASMSDCFDSNG